VGVTGGDTVWGREVEVGAGGGGWGGGEVMRIWGGGGWRGRGSGVV